MLVWRGGRHESKPLHETHGVAGFGRREKAQRKNMQRKETDWEEEESEEASWRRGHLNFLLKDEGIWAPE